MIKTSAIITRCVKRAAQLDPESLVPMNTFSGGLADYLTPGTFGGRRAGRATALADAVGEDAGFNVRHPKSSDLLAALAGAAIGGAAGITPTMVTNMKTYNQSFGQALNSRDNIPGALIGSGAGMVLATLLNAYRRRARMKEINDSVRAAKKLDPKRPGYDVLDTLAIGGGSHRQGRLEALRALTGQNPNIGNGADIAKTGIGVAGSAVNGVFPGAGLVSGLANTGIDFAQNVGARNDEMTDPRISRLAIAD